MSRATALFLASLVMLWASGLHAEMVKCTDPPFVLAVPKGFEEYPEGKSDPDTVCAFVSTNHDVLGRSIMIFVDRMHKRITKGAFSETDLAVGRAFSDLPPDATLTASRGTWRDFEINIVRIRMTEDGAPVSYFVAQVPVKSESVMVITAAHRDLEEQCRKALDDTLASLDAEGQWASKAEWYMRPRNLVIFGGVFAAIVGFKWLVRRD